MSETKERRVRLCNEEFVRAMDNAMRIGPGHGFNAFRATRRIEAVGTNQKRDRVKMCRVGLPQTTVGVFCCVPLFV